MFLEFNQNHALDRYTIWNMSNIFIFSHSHMRARKLALQSLGLWKSSCQAHIDLIKTKTKKKFMWIFPFFSFLFFFYNFFYRLSNVISFNNFIFIWNLSNILLDYIFFYYTFHTSKISWWSKINCSLIYKTFKFQVFII